MSVVQDRSGRAAAKTVVVADRLAAALSAEGVEFVIGFPENRLFDAAARLEIPPVITRTERVAVNIADGFARVTGGRRHTAVAVQYGPGAEAAVGAVAQAASDGTPLLLLPSDYDHEDRDLPPNRSAADLFAPVASWTATLSREADGPEALRRAFGLLRGAPASGPIVIAVRNDLLSAESRNGPWEYRPIPRRVASANPEDVSDVLERLAQARRPVILAGQGVLYAEAWAELQELAELTGIPVATSLNGKSAFPEDHPLALGAAGRSRPSTVDRFLSTADVILGIGTSFTRSFYSMKLPAAAQLGQIVDDVRRFGNSYDVEFGCLGDAKMVLRQLLDGLRKDGPASGRLESNAAEIREEVARFRVTWGARLTSDEEPISPYRIISELTQVIDPSRTVATHEAGNPRDQFLPFYQTSVPHGYIGWGKSTQLGTSLGLALGAKLALPERLCVAFMGDAAFGMVGMDFETAVRCKLPIVVIVMNNGLMGGYSTYMPDAVAKFGAHRVSGKYAAIAKALGGYGQRVERVQDLRPAFQRAISSTSQGQAALVEVVTREYPEFPLGSPPG